MEDACLSGPYIVVVVFLINIESTVGNIIIIENYTRSFFIFLYCIFIGTYQKPACEFLNSCRKIVCKFFLIFCWKYFINPQIHVEITGFLIFLEIRAVGFLVFRGSRAQFLMADFL